MTLHLSEFVDQLPNFLTEYLAASWSTLPGLQDVYGCGREKISFGGFVHPTSDPFTRTHECKRDPQERALCHGHHRS